MVGPGFQPAGAFPGGSGAVERRRGCRVEARLQAKSLAPLLLAIGTLGAQSLAITGATVFDGTGAEPRQATVLIRDGRIAGVGATLAIPEGVPVIHADGLALLPGLFDLHTHLTASGVIGTRADWLKNVKSYLVRGITTVDEFGTYGETFEPYRKLLAGAPSPRILFASRLSTPGGHGAEAGRGEDFSYEVLTPRQGRAAVQKAVPYHPDLIKVFTDGWRYNTAPDMTSMDEATLAAIVDEAHKSNLPVLTHTVTLARAKIAARAGVDVLAHGVGDADVDAELIALMKSHHMRYVSTLAVYEPRGQQVQQPARAARWQYLLRNIAALRAGGITFSVGTDGGETGTPHGESTLRELELLVQGGLTPAEALVAATRNSAEAVHATDRGTIAEGKVADLVLVDGQPWRDISDIRKTRRVFLGGREIDRDQLAREIAAPGLSPIAAVKARALIDDFEKPERSSLDTLRITNTDAGHDHAQLLFARTIRRGDDHALTLIGRMTDKDRPFARVVIPLTRGAVEPVDARAFRGIRFEARGEGEYRVIVVTRTETWSAAFTGAGKWRTARVPFSALATAAKDAKWSGDDLLSVMFEAARAPGEKVWLELDNLRFY
jgi:imidazolonepropionase-like amidohydrolase